MKYLRFTGSNKLFGGFYAFNKPRYYIITSASWSGNPVKSMNNKG